MKARGIGSRANVAALNYVSAARRRAAGAGEQAPAAIFRRLLIEVALASDYHLRLEHPTSAGRWLTRIVHPLALESGSEASPEGLLRARLVQESHQVSFPVAKLERISLVTEHLASDVVVRGNLTVGDAVESREYGFGVVQAFPGSPADQSPEVLFALHGPRRVRDPAASLTRIVVEQRVP